MNISIHEEQGTMLLALTGTMSQDDVALFKNRLFELLESGIRRIIIDMNEVPYISSMGLAVMVTVVNKITALNGVLRLARLSPTVSNLFTITNLLKKIPVYDRVEDALKDD